MLYLLCNFAVLVGFVGIFTVSGRWLDRSGGGGLARTPVPMVCHFGLGAALWMGVVFALATLQLLDRRALVVVLVLLLGLAWRGRRSRGAGTDFGTETAVPPDSDLRARLLALGLGVLLAILWLQNQWPTLAWDADVYHLTVPRLYLERGGFYRIPFNVYSNWPLNTQLLYALALVARGFVAAKTLHFAFGVAVLLVVHRVVAHRRQAWAGWVAAALFLLNPVVLDEIRVAYVDLAYTFFFLVTFVLIHRALSDADSADRSLLLAGVFGGVAAGIKPTGILGVLGLVIVYLAAAARRGGRWRGVFGGALRVLIPTGLLLLPWAIKSWFLTGNPAYPFLYTTFGGPEWSVELGEQLAEWQQGIGMGRGWSDYLLLPLRVIARGDRGYESFDGRILRSWLVLVPFALAMSRGRPLIGRSLAAAGLTFVGWALTSQQMRFLIPVLPLLAIAAAVALSELAARVSVPIRRALGWGTTLALLAALGYQVARLIPQTAEMLRQYRIQGAEIVATAEHPVFTYIDAELPDDAKLLFLNTNHGFFCRREFIADSFFEASQINALFLETGDSAGIGVVLADLGVTHLLIENRDRRVPWPRHLFEYLNDPAKVRPIYRSPDNVYDVVEIVSGVQG